MSKCIKTTVSLSALIIGFLIICDTKELLDLEEKFYKTGEYKHTFYPLGSALVKARKLGGCGFSERLFNRYIGEDEYIMRTNLRKYPQLKMDEKGLLK